jgi:hypothetical protein
MDVSKVMAPFGPRRRLLVVAVAALGLFAASSCSAGTPQAILNVPGNYVANLWNPPPGYAQSAGASVLMCLDESSAVRVETGEGGQGWIGSIDLDWFGTRFHADSGGSATTLTTPVLQPGCGTLTFVVDCCHVDNYLAVKVSKVPIGP